MGTRSLTRILDEQGNVLACMYRQHDGYPSGHGKELAEFLAPLAIVNGLGSRDARVANGMDCLAAQVVAYFKMRRHDREKGWVASEVPTPGDIYLMAPNTKDVGEEYVYELRAGKETREVVIKCMSVGFRGQRSEWRTKFEGSAAEFLAWVAREEEE